MQRRGSLISLLTLGSSLVVFFWREAGGRGAEKEKTKTISILKADNGIFFPSLLLQLKEVQTEHDAVTFVNLISLIIGQITLYLNKPAQAPLFYFIFLIMGPRLKGHRHIKCMNNNKGRKPQGLNFLIYFLFQS